MTAPIVVRYHSLDALRAAMMLLGLVLHAGASYTYEPLGDAWPFHDPPGLLAISLLLVVIHLFRMPVFFVVAGFFAAYLYYREGAAPFARNRARRVALPLVIFWATALPLAGLGFLFAAHREGAGIPGELIPPGSPLRVPILGHLWFLYDLLIFYGAALVIAPLAARLPPALRRAAERLFRSLVTRRWGVLALGLVTTATLVPMLGPGIETSAALLPPPRILAAYSVFFGFGWLLFAQRDLIEAFGSRWTATLAGGMLLSVGYVVVLLAQRRMDPAAWHLAGVTAAGFAVWLLIYGMIGIFVRHVRAERRAVRYFSDASYWIYLTHLVPITWTAGLLAPAGLAAAVKFLVVLTAATVTTTVTYHFLVRSTAVGVLLNGRRYPRSRQLAAEPHLVP